MAAADGLNTTESPGRWRTGWESITGSCRRQIRRCSGGFRRASWFPVRKISTGRHRARTGIERRSRRGDCRGWQSVGGGSVPRWGSPRSSPLCDRRTEPPPTAGQPMVSLLVAVFSCGSKSTRTGRERLLELNTEPPASGADTSIRSLGPSPPSGAGWLLRGSGGRVPRRRRGCLSSSVRRPSSDRDRTRRC